VVVLVVIFGKGIGMMSLQMLAEGIINWKLQLPLLVLLALVIVFYVMYRRRQM
jgi:predicted tellurium resistance membrane protein TerC